MSIKRRNMPFRCKYLKTRYPAKAAIKKEMSSIRNPETVEAAASTIDVKTEMSPPMPKIPKPGIKASTRSKIIPKTKRKIAGQLLIPVNRCPPK